MKATQKSEVKERYDRTLEREGGKVTETVHTKAYLNDIKIFCDRAPESLPPGVREY